MNTYTDKVHSEQGFALLLALFVVASVMVLGMSIMTISMISSESSGTISVSQQNFQVADGATELGKNWLSGKVEPPEDDSSYNNAPPWEQYTSFSNDMNPIDPKTSQPFLFPQYRYKIDKYGTPGPKMTGESLGTGQDYGSSVPTWHYYKVTAESRSGRAAAAGYVDRTVTMILRRLYVE